jgi:hypothetical protein
MSLLSKAETHFLRGQKQVSKSYEYKLKSKLKKKVSCLLDNDLPLLSALFPNLIALTKFSRKEGLSSRRSRVQIPAGASVISEVNSNIKSCNSEEKFASLLTDDEKSLSKSEDNGQEYSENIPIKEQSTILPNSVRRKAL